MSEDIMVEKVGFTFMWCIENYSVFCANRPAYRSIPSPTFVAETLDRTEWYLSFYRPIVTLGLGNFYLYRSKSTDGPKTIRISASVSALAANGDYLITKKSENNEFEVGTCKLFSLDGYSPDNISDFLTDGMITIRCHIWKHDSEATESMKCYARTRIGMVRLSGVWNIVTTEGHSGKKQTFSLQSASREHSTLHFSGFPAKSSGYFHIEIRLSNNKNNVPYNVGGKITVLNANKSLSASSSCELNSTHQWHFPNFILKRDPKYNSQLLQLLCEFIIFTGNNVSIIEETHAWLSKDLDVFLDERRSFVLRPKNSNELPTWGLCYCDNSSQTSENIEFQHKSRMKSDDSKPFNTASIACASPKNLGTLADDIIHVFKQKKFCDIILRSSDETFLAHKMVLCARSEKFRSILVEPKKEKRFANVIKIELDSDQMPSAMHNEDETISGNVTEKITSNFSERETITINDVADNRMANYQYDENMENRIEDFVIISDIDSKTMSLMLDFLYTDFLAENQTEVTIKLYLASLKYGIPSLKEKCFFALKSILRASNVCEIFMSFDGEDDKDIEEICKTFFCQHVSDILRSKEWADVMEKKPKLSSKLMYLFCLHKTEG